MGSTALPCLGAAAIPAVSSSTLGPFLTAAGFLTCGAAALAAGAFASWPQEAKKVAAQIAAIAATAAYLVVIMSPAIHPIINK